MKHNIKIKVDEQGKGSTILDGRDISDMVAAVGFNSEPGEPTQVSLVLTVDEVEIEGDVEDSKLFKANMREIGTEESCS